MPFFIVTYGVFNGTGLGFISLVISVACNHYFTKRRALAVGIGKTGISLASVIFPPLTNYVLNYGWKSVIYMYASVALLSAFFGCLIRPLNSYSKVPSNEEGISTTMEPCDKIMENNVQRKEHSNEEHFYDFNYNANKEKQNTALYEVEKLHIDELSNENTDNLYKHILDTESSITKKRDLKKKVTQFKNKTNTRRTLVQSLDLSTWCSPPFILFTTSVVFSHLGWMLYFIFVPSMLTETKNFSSTQASLVLTSTGITNTISRVLAGLIMDHPQINPALFMSLAYTLSGFVLIILPFATNYTSFVILGGIFGLVASTGSVGTAIVLGIMLPIEKVASAFGIVGFVQGGGVIIGPTISGYVYDMTHDFDAIFVSAGLSYIISGFLCWMSNYLYYKQKKNESTPKTSCE
jgi:MFS family permease